MLKFVPILKINFVKCNASNFKFFKRDGNQKGGIQTGSSGIKILSSRIHFEGLQTDLPCTLFF